MRRKRSPDGSGNAAVDTSVQVKTGKRPAEVIESGGSDKSDDQPRRKKAKKVNTSKAADSMVDEIDELVESGESEPGRLYSFRKITLSY